MLKRRFKILAVVAAAVIALAPALAEAQAGRGQSSGSRGARTQQAAPSTPTTPNAARPVERSATQPSTAARPGAMQSPQQQSWFQRNPFMTGLLGGMLGAGLIGMLMGGGLNFGEGLAGMMGLMLQLALVAGAAFLIMRFIRSRRAQPQPAAAHGTAGAPPPDFAARTLDQNQPIDVRPSGGSAPGGAFAPKGGDEIGLLASDFDAFEQRLAEVQAAWSKSDLAALRRAATPEMVSYFSEDLAADSSRGQQNRVEQVKLDQGDLSEAWQEGATQYATVAMRWSGVVYTVSLADDRVVEGSREQRREFTEVWTFMRAQGGNWVLSAIQQV
jgi:predicted lipid-binding transport protein (Tim44 family)